MDHLIIIKLVENYTSLDLDLSIYFLVIRLVRFVALAQYRNSDGGESFCNPVERFFLIMGMLLKLQNLVAALKEL